MVSTISLSIKDGSHIEISIKGGVGKDHAWSLLYLYLLKMDPILKY